MWYSDVIATGRRSAFLKPSRLAQCKQSSTACSFVKPTSKASFRCAHSSRSPGIFTQAIMTEKGPKPFRIMNIRPDPTMSETFLLSPNDFFATYTQIPLSWPMFFDYDINGDDMVEGLKALMAKYPIMLGRVKPDEDTRYVIEVDGTGGKKHGIKFQEYNADFSVAAAIREHMQLKVESADYPVHPKIPFFLESLDTDAVLRGEEPLMKVKLTHFTDGCVVSVAVIHMMLDGQRYMELIRDMARGYLEKEIPDRVHDRSYLWPDQVVKKFEFLGEEVAAMPRKVLPAGEFLEFPKYPDEGCQLRTLYIPNEALEKIKAVVKPYMSDGEFISTNDALVALGWMLECELEVGQKPISTGADLDINNTFLLFSFEALKNGYPVVPENYCGNAFTAQLLTNAGTDMSETSLPELFAKLALTMRKTLSDLKSQPPLFAQSLLAYYAMTSTGKFPTLLPFDRFRGSSTSLVKTPINEIDFGEGPPLLAYIVPLPFSGSGFPVGPAPKGKGIFMSLLLRDSQLATFDNSVVLNEFVPERKDIFTGLTTEEFKQVLGMP